MQSSSQPQSQMDIKRRYLMTISSLNKTSNDGKSRNYQTLDKNQRLSVGNVLNNSSGQCQMISTKIINVDFNIQLLNSYNKNYRNHDVMNRALYPSSERNKSRYDDINREIFRKGKGGVRVIAKYKYPLSDDKTPMKKYIKIQRIKLPSPDPSTKTSAIKIKQTIPPQLSENMKKTIEQYNKYVEKNKERESISKIGKSKLHRRNHSSIIQNFKCAISTSEDCMVIERPKKICTQDFPVRRPLGRKDYFVFGMSDRTNPENKVQYYRDFLWKINFSNALHVYTPDQVANPYRAYIGPGNNYHLVKSVLKRRFWWTIVEKNEGYENLNFLWTQLKQNTFYTFQQNSKYEIQSSLKTESSSMILKKSDSETTKQQTPNSTVEDFHKKVFGKSDMYSWNKHLSKNQKTQQKINQLTYIKRLSLFLNKDVKNIENSSKLKIHNHLQSNFFIGNKKALFYNMRRYLTLKNIDPFTILPLTFHVAKGIEDSEFKVFKKHFEQIQANKNTTGLRNIWIVKPGQNTNRGNGITVAYSLDDIIIRLKGKQKNGDGKLRTFIIQKYIQRPLLYCKRKFDIRHYMLITCTNGIFKAYWYEEGYIRTSSSQFTTKYSKDPFVHLTNDAIQKNGANYGRFEKGNKLSYQDFQRYLQTNYKSKKINFFDNILPQMKQMATESVRATYAILDENRKQNNFELLGLDFMIDEDFKPWLIEVNTNPCLELSCSLLQKIIPQLIDNLFRICIDPLFPPPQCWQSGKKLYFGDYPLSQNKFEIIFDEYDDGHSIQQLYKGSSKLDQKMGKIQEDDEIFEDDGDQNWENQK